MTRKEIKVAFLEILSRWLEEGDSFDSLRVDEASRLVEDLELDSLDVIELVMATESRFNIDITDEDALGIRTVQDTLDLLVRLTA